MTTDYSVELLRDFVNVVGNDPDPNTLVSNLALRTLTHLDCRGVILGVIRHEGFLDLIGTYGYPDELTDPYKKNTALDAASDNRCNSYRQADRAYLRRRNDREISALS